MVGSIANSTVAKVARISTVWFGAKKNLQVCGSVGALWGEIVSYVCAVGVIVSVD